MRQIAESRVEFLPDWRELALSIRWDWPFARRRLIVILEGNRICQGHLQQRRIPDDRLSGFGSGRSRCDAWGEG